MVRFCSRSHEINLGQGLVNFIVVNCRLFSPGIACSENNLASLVSEQSLLVLP